MEEGQKLSGKGQKVICEKIINVDEKLNNTVKFRKKMSFEKIKISGIRKNHWVK